MSDPIQPRSEEVSDLLLAIKSLIDPFIAAADPSSSTHGTGHGAAVPGGGPRTALIEHHAPRKLSSLLSLDLPSTGTGKDGVLALTQKLLAYSVNTWDQGFMDKLYATTDAPGVAAELLLAVLNTNCHVYSVAPALTLVEKFTIARLAEMVWSPVERHAGGIGQPGGSASNALAMVTARNAMFPETKGEGLGGRRFTIFTSAHGHYSVRKAGQMFGFGEKNVIAVAVDGAGRMRAEVLRTEVRKSRERGDVPFFVNATAGTTVLGSFDPLDELAEICREEGLWLHVDGSWGGAVVFSEKLRKDRLNGAERVDSFTITPHKMLGVPVTCSFLLVRDARKLYAANAIDAEYLFHDQNSGNEVFDLGQLTSQCGRKGDALKMFFGWTYHGTEGYAKKLEHAHGTATYLCELLEKNENFILLSERPPPCMQVCFNYAPEGFSSDPTSSTKTTERIARRLVPMGWMVDYAPDEKGGKMFRVVVNRETARATVEGLVMAIEHIGTNDVAKDD